MAFVRPILSRLVRLGNGILDSRKDNPGILPLARKEFAFDFEEHLLIHPSETNGISAAKMALVSKRLRSIRNAILC